MDTLQPGDRVRFNYPTAVRDGQTATVVKVDDSYHASVLIEFDGEWTTDVGEALRAAPTTTTGASRAAAAHHFTNGEPMATRDWIRFARMDFEEAGFDTKGNGPMQARVEVVANLAESPMYPASRVSIAVSVDDNREGCLASMTPAEARYLSRELRAAADAAEQFLSPEDREATKKHAERFEQPEAPPPMPPIVDGGPI